MILSCALCLFGCKAQNSGFKSVGANEFEEFISDQNVVRLDVRTAEEYADGHISDAINIDVTKNDFESVALAMLPKGHPIAVNCRSGKRSKKAANFLVKNGFEVVELESGFNGWIEAGKPSTKEEVDLFLTDNGMCVYLYSIKHGSVKMRIGDKWLYVDPVTNAVPPVTDFKAMPKADIVLITHEHQDHLDANAINDLTKKETVLLVNQRSGELLGGKGEVMKNGDKKSVLDLQIEAVPAYNNSVDKQKFHPKGRDNGYIITADGLRIYVAGDTEDIEEMAVLKDIDIAFLPCNLPFTMTPEQLVKATKKVMPKVLFPYHYGKTDINCVMELLKGCGVDVRIRRYQ